MAVLYLSFRSLEIAPINMPPTLEARLFARLQRCQDSPSSRIVESCIDLYQDYFTFKTKPSPHRYSLYLRLYIDPDLEVFPKALERQISPVAFKAYRPRAESPSGVADLDELEADGEALPCMEVAMECKEEGPLPIFSSQPVSFGYGCPAPTICRPRPLPRAVFMS